jgi:mono/diheme cytochrome c family protein
MTAVLRVVSLIVLAVAAAAAAVAGAAIWAAGADGLSARTAPSTVERLLARAARRWAVPRAARGAVNPIVFSPEVWTESRAHFADHCASCHANDGSGRTEMGQNLYPKAPDMRLADTQNLTDGELYWIIENGIRLTGMPAWGSGDGNDPDTWKLVHFIRRLKDLSSGELKIMQGLNPRSPAELEEEQADQRFLAGEAPDAPSPPVHHHD